MPFYDLHECFHIDTMFVVHTCLFMRDTILLTIDTELSSTIGSLINHFNLFSNIRHHHTQNSPHRNVCVCVLYVVNSRSLSLIRHRCLCSCTRMYVCAQLYLLWGGVHMCINKRVLQRYKRLNCKFFFYLAFGLQRDSWKPVLLGCSFMFLHRSFFFASRSLVVLDPLARTCARHLSKWQALSKIQARWWSVCQGDQENTNVLVKCGYTVPHYLPGYP